MMLSQCIRRVVLYEPVKKKKKNLAGTSGSSRALRGQRRR